MFKNNLFLVFLVTLIAITAVLKNVYSDSDDLLLDDGSNDLLSDSNSNDLLGGDSDDSLLKSSGDDLLGGESDDLLSGDSDSLLGGDESVNDLLATEDEPKKEATPKEVGADAHEALFLENKFPSATTCATCHPDHYREWSVSAHAYAQLSPVFNAMHATIVKQTTGTNGDFCIRCHTQVGMQLEEPVFMSNLDRHPTSREGITCIVCHRVNQNYGKVSGRTAIVEGDIFEPVYGPSGNTVLKEVLEEVSKYKVNTDRSKAGRNIHTEVVKLDAMTTSGFCGTCHDVNLLNGFRLEEAFSQFKNSPAAARGESCQDCHMGKIPGLKSGYDKAPAAIIGGNPTPERKRTNHMFAGPDYSIVHPGIFPHNTKAQELASLANWLEFDVEAGWGTDEFENNAPDDYKFPQSWKYIDDRYEARKILDGQFELLREIELQRYQILRRAIQLNEFVVKQYNDRGIKFGVKVVNGTDGHGAPTGFDAERLMVLEVTVTDASGKVVFRSGDRDPNGDVRDIHSSYVHNWELPIDKYLFNLQSKFLTLNVRGGEREQVLAVNYSLDPLPYIRPDSRSTILTARPFAARKQSRGLPPGSHRWANYKIKKSQLTKGPYKVNLKFYCQMVPVNLVKEIEGVGFDYGMSTREVAEGVVNGAQLIWNIDLPLNGEDKSIKLKPTEEEIMAPPSKKVKTITGEEKGTLTYNR